MRLQLYLEAPERVPFDYLPTLVGAFHRWNGHDPGLHDGTSLYSLSWLRGGRAAGPRSGLRFASGAHWAISAPDETLIRRLVGGVVRAPDLGLGLRVRDVQLLDAPPFAAGEQAFRVASPVFLKWQPPGDGPADHILWHDERADELLTAVFHRKLTQAGLPTTGAAVRFDRTFAGAKTKLFRYKAVQCRASQCPVLVTGSSEQLRFAWAVGVGHSTGIGCGALE